MPAAWQATAAPAWAGGVGGFLSPAIDNSCANHHTATPAQGATTHGTGALNGNLAGLPVRSPLNQCGGADLPDVCTITQPLPDTNILSGYVLNDAVDAPIDVIVQVITIVTTADLASDNPITSDGCA